MPDNLFIIDIKDFLMNGFEQFRLWFHSQHFALFETFKPYLLKALKNPLATAITLIALFGIPFTLIKIKKTSTEAGKRLDKLIEELDQYEVNKPKINLKKKLQNDFPEKSESSESYGAADGENLQCPAEPVGEKDFIVRSLNLPKERLATDNLIALPPLYFKDEPTDTQQETLSVTQNEEEEEFSATAFPQKTFSLTGEDSEPDWDQLTESGAGNEVPAPSAASKYEEDDFAGLEIQDLQQEMEMTIQKLTRQLSSQDSEEAPDAEEVNAAPILSDFNPDFNAIESQSPAEDIYIEEPDEELQETSLQPEAQDQDVFAEPSWEQEEPGSVKPDSIITQLKTFQEKIEEPDEELQETSLQPEAQDQDVFAEPSWEQEEPDSVKPDSIITQLKTFQEKLETRFQPEGVAKIQDSNEPGSTKTGETILKPTGIACSLPSKAKDRDYQELLESLILLNNPRKNS